MGEMINPSRREFNKQLAGSLLAYGLIEMLWHKNLFAGEIKPVIDAWFKELYEIGQELHNRTLSDVEFQAKMEDLFRKVQLEELVGLARLESMEKNLSLPDNGAFSGVLNLSKVDGLPTPLNFGRQIFGMKKDRAIVPHGHANMCTGFIVLKGNFRGRHYDRLETAEDHYIIKPTIDSEFGPGGVSTISDHKDNVHWFHCTSETGFIFNAHFLDYDPSIKITTGRLYLDPEGEKLADGLIKAPVMTSEDCHKKYG